ncbi:MAG: NAD-dependent epimerase/dehydratase family protein [Beijerinckiaceae bacterium]|nr:NAD-dependent epimerase/dehydratase family protein [Beijerinckiaceae bacterium]
MARIIVTGATGVVGQALMECLSARGEDALALRGRSGVNLENLDETVQFFERQKPELVYHLAGAVFGLGGNRRFPGDAFRRNVLINTHVIEACRRAGVKKIVAMGSAAMYADRDPPYFSEDVLMMGLPHDSELAYGFAKRAMLIQLESYKQQFGLQFAFAVATNMYGPHDRFDPVYGHVIPSLVVKFASAGSDEKVELWGDGSPTRDFLFALDAAEALVLLMEKGDGAYNVATGKSVAISELVACLHDLFPGRESFWNTSKPSGQRERQYSVSRLASLGFEPKFDLRAGLKRTVDWYLANQEIVRRHV